MLLRKKAVLAAKLEAACGTAESLTATEAAFVVYDVDAKLNLERIERNALSYSRLPGVIGGRQATVTFKAELMGLGSSGSPAWASVFLPCVGMVASSQTWAVSSLAPVGSGNAGPHTCTIGFYHDGRKIAFAGCMGNMKIVSEAGKLAYAEFSFQGCYVGMTDAALLAPTLPTLAPIRGLSNAVSLGGTSTPTAKWELDLGNSVNMVADVTTASGYRHALVGDRNPRLTLSKDAVLVATKDTYGALLSGASEAVAITMGGATWNKIEIAAPAAQVAEAQVGDANGLLTDDLVLALVRNTAEDDELTISFTSGS